MIIYTQNKYSQVERYKQKMTWVNTIEYDDKLYLVKTVVVSCAGV